MKFLLVLAAIAVAAWVYLKPLPPGQGPNAQAGMRASAAIIQTVESYRSARGVYPLNLSDLVPEFLSGVPHLSNGSEIEYERLGANYKLSFNYTNPLPVHCNYSPGSKWQCEWF
jgi:hypothetical protein